MPPSFLKNTRSFIQNMSQNVQHDYSYFEGQRKLYDHSDCNSINLSDRQSMDDFETSSINNSLRDLSEKGDKMSVISGSNQGNSIELTR